MDIKLELSLWPKGEAGGRGSRRLGQDSALTWSSSQRVAGDQRQGKLSRYSLRSYLEGIVKAGWVQVEKRGGCTAAAPSASVKPRGQLNAHDMEPTEEMQAAAALLRPRFHPAKSPGEGISLPWDFGPWKLGLRLLTFFFF